MRNFLMNWDYKKHATAVSCLYLGVSLIGNAALGKPVPKDEKSINPVEKCKKMTKGQWIFNSILTFCYAMEMSATYLALRHWRKQYK